TLHLTLAFLGGTPGDRVHELRQAATGWQTAVAPITLRRLGRFKGPRVVWAGPAQEDSLPWLARLHQDLWRHLEDMGWQRPDEPFRPHVSLLRKAGPQDLTALHRPPLTWMPDQCVLVASQPLQGGSRYRMLARMPLQRLS